MSPRARKPIALAVVAVCAMLAGCAVGPEYTGPPALTPAAGPGATFKRAPAVGVESSVAPARWWLFLNDAVLTRLIDEGLAASPTVAQAQAKLRVARAALGESRAGSGPTGGATATALAVHPPQSGLGRLLSQGGGDANPDIYVTGFDASWELDPFGRQRRDIEASAAMAGLARAELADSQVELAADIARGYVALREAQQHLAFAGTALILRGRVLDLTRQRRARGVAGDAEVARAQAGLEQTSAEIADLLGRVDQALDQIAVLVGLQPGALDEALRTGGDQLMPPANTPIGDPAGLLRRRPDIRAAERRLAAGDAEIGRSMAQLFPSVSLRGDIGFSASDPASLLTRSSFLALGGPSLTWNILDYPRIRARIRGAEAMRDADLADYRRVALSALRDAEDSLSRYGRQRAIVVATQNEAVIAARLCSIDKDRRGAGTLSEIDATDAQLRDLQARDTVVQARSALTLDYIALEKSLGLGWE